MKFTFKENQNKSQVTCKYNFLKLAISPSLLNANVIVNTYNNNKYTYFL